MWHRDFTTSDGTDIRGTANYKTFTRNHTVADGVVEITMPTDKTGGLVIENSYATIFPVSLVVGLSDVPAAAVGTTISIR